jgi:hypothetical protein
MPGDFAKVQITGLNEVVRDLRRMKQRDILIAIKDANKEAAEKVALQAKVEVPVRSGKLQRSIRPGATQRSGFVKAGSAVRVPYAGPIHFGWFRHHILPQPFLYKALDKRIGEVYAAYERQIEKVIARFNH